MKHTKQGGTNLDKAIKQMYTGLTVRFAINKEVAKIPQTVRVRQGNIYLPILFLFFMSTFGKPLEAKWEQSGFSTAQFMRVSADDIANGKDQITGHQLRSTFNNVYGTGSIFDILQMFYIDNGAFIFACQEERIKKMTDKHFKKFGMEIHVGQNEKNSKTECMCILTQAFLKKTYCQSTMNQTQLAKQLSNHPLPIKYRKH